jgi:hypothetical protein
VKKHRAYEDMGDFYTDTRWIIVILNAICSIFSVKEQDVSSIEDYHSHNTEQQEEGMKNYCQLYLDPKRVFVKM